MAMRLISFALCCKGRVLFLASRFLHEQRETASDTQQSKFLYGNLMYGNYEDIRYI
jgi:hypothetical protein